MNYRHAYHAGNYADVFKHALLVRLVRALQRKEKGFLYVDTHAGRGRYDLARAARGGSREREPEWPEGIGRLWARTDAPPELRDYVELVRDFDRSRGNLLGTPRFYPGSPRIARALARPQDRLELWEREPAECAALRREFSGERRVAVHEADGYGAPRACLPPAERRALVLLDPPFEAADEGERAARALAEAVRRLPGGTYAVWYPLSRRARAAELLGWLERGRLAWLVAELEVDPQAAAMTGCALAVVNPPWKFADEARPILAYLGDALSLGHGAQGSVRGAASR